VFLYRKSRPSTAAHIPIPKGCPLSSSAPHRYLGTLRACCIAAASASGGGASAATDLCGAATPGNLERWSMVGPLGRHSGAGRRVSRLHGALGEGFPLGIAGLIYGLFRTA
jgi:hypothetical protein